METKDEFYVYLSSEFNKNEFPLNNSNSFTNIIKPFIPLSSTYDVALENIIFDPKIPLIKKNDENYSANIFIEFTKKNGSKGGYGVVYFPESHIKADNINNLIDHINNDLVQFLRRNGMISKDQTIIFKLKQFTSFIDFYGLIPESEYKSFMITWRLSTKLAEVLGVQDLTFNTKPRLLTTPKLPKRLDCIHLYSDIIEASYFGNQTTHLLDIIPLPHMLCKTGTLTLFKRVNRNFLDSISIKMTDGKGLPITFTEEVPVMIVLHFRRSM